MNFFLTHISRALLKFENSENIKNLSLLFNPEFLHILCIYSVPKTLSRKEKRKFAIVKKEVLSIKQKLIFLKEILIKGETIRMEELLHKDKELGSINIVLTFISLLELSRLRKVDLFQNEPLGQIYIEVLESLQNFDVESATGFEEEEEAIRKAY